MNDVSTDNQAGLLVVPNKPVPEHVKQLLRLHKEGLIICVDSNDNESDIVVFSKFLDRGVLAKYLASLLQNLMKTANVEQSYNRDESTPAISS